MQRVGARIWIARIMIVWGLVSMAMMFIKTVPMFYAMRFLLGAAEAGFFPGVILYLTYWYPAKERARTIALFATGGVVAGIVGSPISGVILGLDGTAGLAGWQWLFLLEALPAVFMGLVVLFILPNGPHHVGWLSATQKTWLRTRLAAEASPCAPGARPPVHGRDRQRPRLVALPDLFPDEYRQLRLRAVAALDHQGLLRQERRDRRLDQRHPVLDCRDRHAAGRAPFGSDR